MPDYREQLVKLAEMNSSVAILGRDDPLKGVNFSVFVEVHSISTNSKQT
jgi:hypothetical protein